jgi:hypothetical protein
LPTEDTLKVESSKSLAVSWFFCARSISCFNSSSILRIDFFWTDLIFGTVSPACESIATEKLCCFLIT